MSEYMIIWLHDNPVLLRNSEVEKPQKLIVTENGILKITDLYYICTIKAEVA